MKTKKTKIVETRFYHYREPMPNSKEPNDTVIKSIGIPMITVCLLKTDDCHYGRGVSICGKNDNPNKKTGRNIAEGRAQQAILNKQCESLVNNDYAIMLFDKHFNEHIGSRFKSEFVNNCSLLYTYEKSLFKAK